MSGEKEVHVVALSSIFTNIKINDPQQAERFIDALEQSANEPRRQPSAPVGPYLTDKHSIRALMANLPPKLGNAIFQQIMSTPKPDDAKLDEEARRLEREMEKIRDRETSQCQE